MEKNMTTQSNPEVAGKLEKIEVAGKSEKPVIIVKEKL